MKTEEMLKHDLKLGIAKYIWVYVVLGTLVFWGSTFFFQMQQQRVDYGELKNTVSGFSMLLFILQGNERYVPNPENTFQLSMLWLLPLILTGYVIYAYPVHDLRVYGYNYMIRTRSRAKWWFAKFGWLLFHILLCTVVMVLAAGVCAWSKGEAMFAMPEQELLDTLELPGLYDMDMPYILAIFALMFITLLAMSMMQMFFSFVFSPITAYIGLIVIYVASVYCTVWLLPGNYLMLLRMQILSGDGINQWMGFPFMAVLFIAVLFGGNHYMKRYDIL